MLAKDIYGIGFKTADQVNDPQSAALAYFDDISAGLIMPEEGCTGLENFWYLERKNARSRVRKAPWANGGRKALVCDATLKSVDYDEWFAGW